MSEPSQWSPLIESPQWRFTLKHLLLTIALVAVGLVALRNASAPWIGALFGIASFVLATAVLLVVFRRGPRQAYWIGFAMFGWLYMALLIGGDFVSREAETPFRSHHLATTQISSASYHWLYDKAFDMYLAQYPQPPRYFDPGTGQALPAGPWPPPGAPPMPGPNAQDFISVTHAIWTIALALVGGQLARWLYATPQRESAAQDRAQPG